MIWILIFLCLIFTSVSVSITLRTAYRAKEVVDSLDAVERNAAGVKREQALPEMESALLEGVTSQTVRDRIRSLGSLRASGSHIDPVALAQGTAETFHQRLAIPRVMANVMVLLGLLGAVSGITSVCSQLSEIVPSYQSRSTDLAELQKAQSEMMRDLGTALEQTSEAFSLSLVGIAGTVVVLVALVLGSSRVESALSRLELLTQQTLLALFSPMLEASAQARMVEAFLESARVLTEVSEGMRSKAALVQEQIDDLYIVVKTFREGASSLTLLSEHLTSLEQLIRTSQTDLARTMEALAGQVRSLGEGQKTDLEALLAGLGERVDAVAGKVGENLQTSRDQAAELANSVLQTLRDQQGWLGEQLERLAPGESELRGVVEDSARRLEDALGRLKPPPDQTSELRGVVEDGIRRLEDALGRLKPPPDPTPGFERLEASLLELVRTVQSQQSAAAEQVSRGLDRQAELLQGMTTRMLPAAPVVDPAPSKETLAGSRTTVDIAPLQACLEEGLRNLTAALSDRPAASAPAPGRRNRWERLAVGVLLAPPLLLSGYLAALLVFGGAIPALLTSGATVLASIVVWAQGTRD